MKLSSSFSACALLLFLSTAAVATPTGDYRTDKELEYLRPYKHFNDNDAWYSWVEFGLVQSLTNVNADTIHQKLLEVRKKQEQDQPPEFSPDSKMLADALSVDVKDMTKIIQIAGQESAAQAAMWGHNDPHQMNTLLEIILSEILYERRTDPERRNDAPERELVRNAIKEARWAIHLEKDQLKRAELEKFFIKKEKHYIKEGLEKLNLLLRELDKMKHYKLDYDTVQSLPELLDRVTKGCKKRKRTEYETGQPQDENESKIYRLINQLMKSPEVKEFTVDEEGDRDVIKQLMEKLMLSPEREEKGDMTPNELEIWCNKQCMMKQSLTGLPPTPYRIERTKRAIKMYGSDVYIALALRDYDDDERLIPLLRDGLKEHRVSESKIQEAMQVARRTTNLETAVKEGKYFAAMKYLEEGGRLEKTRTLKLLDNPDLHCGCGKLVEMLEQLWPKTVVFSYFV